MAYKSRMSDVKKHNIEARRFIAAKLNMTEVNVKKHLAGGRVVLDEDGKILIDESINNIVEFQKSTGMTNVNQIRKRKKATNANIDENQNQSGQFNENEEDFIKKYEEGSLTMSEMLKVFDYDLIKKLEIIEKTRKQKIDNDERLGLLINKKTVENELEKLGKLLNDRMSEIPNRLSAELAGIDDPLEVKIYLKEELTSIMLDISKGISKLNE